MLDIIERLGHEKMLVDAGDDAINEIIRLRDRIEELQEAQIQLETAWGDYSQSALEFPPVLNFSGFSELEAAIRKMLEA